MRRSASEIIKNLEMRVARLEKSAGKRSKTAKETPIASIKLGRRGRDHFNTQIY